MRTEGIYLNVVKAIRVANPQPTSYSMGKNYKHLFPLRSQRIQGCSLSPLLSNTVLEVLATEIIQEEIKGTQTGKTDK